MGASLRLSRRLRLIAQIGFMLVDKVEESRFEPSP